MMTWLPCSTTPDAAGAILGRLAKEVPVTGNLVPDAQLAALALEHGLTVMTADTDFARFPDVAWRNPLST